MDLKRITYSDDWIFSIDVEKTTGFYSKQKEPVDKSFLKRYPDSLKDFLVLCGIDYEKPCDGFTEHDSEYYLFGEAVTTTGYELDFYGENLFASIFVEFEQPLHGLSFSMVVFY